MECLSNVYQIEVSDNAQISRLAQESMNLSSGEVIFIFQYLFSHIEINLTFWISSNELEVMLWHCVSNTFKIYSFERVSSVLHG